MKYTTETGTTLDKTVKTDSKPNNIRQGPKTANSDMLANDTVKGPWPSLHKNPKGD